MHGLESQNDSIVGGQTDSIVGTPHVNHRPDGRAVDKSYRMPVHSFTTPAAQKTHSSQINSRRNMIGVDKTAASGHKEDSIELHMYQKK